MIHTDFIKIVSGNTDKFEQVYYDLQNLEVSCELISDAGPEDIDTFIDMMKNSLIKYKTSKCELVTDSIGQPDTSV